MSTQSQTTAVKTRPTLSRRRTKIAATICGLFAFALVASAAVAANPPGPAASDASCSLAIAVRNHAGRPVRDATIRIAGSKPMLTDRNGDALAANATCEAVKIDVIARDYAPWHGVAPSAAAGQKRVVAVRLQPVALAAQLGSKAPADKEKAEKARPKPSISHSYGLGAAAAPAKAYRGMGSGGGGGVAVGRAGAMGYAGGMRQPEPSSREGYTKSEEERFSSTQDKPLSTFSIDVDTASWSNLRRFVQRQGALPPQAAVRIEEMINAFPYSWAGPSDDHPFAVHTEVSIAPWNPAHRLMAIAVQGRRMEVKHLPPANLVFLLDVSGSMGSPDKLPLLQASLAMLVREMRPEDHVSIVVYAGAAGLVLPPTSGADQTTILDALANLSAGGSTAGGAGLQLAYQVARNTFVKGGNNRVILATDGDFNVGPSSDGEMVQLIEKERDSGVFLTVLGFGSGNYQDAKMQELAQHGNGNHAYIDTLIEARRVLIEQMGGTLLTIAKDVKIQVEPNPRLVKDYRLIGYDNRRLATRDFADDTKDAGELGAGHTVTALYEIIPAGSTESLGANAGTKYTAVRATDAAATDELATVRLRYKEPRGSKSQLVETVVHDKAVALKDTSADFRFATAVAELGLLLSGSKLAGSAALPALIARAEAAMGADVGGHRAGFLAIAKRVAALRTATTAAETAAVTR